MRIIETGGKQRKKVFRCGRNATHDKMVTYLVSKSDLDYSRGGFRLLDSSARSGLCGSNLHRRYKHQPLHEIFRRIPSCSPVKKEEIEELDIALSNCKKKVKEKKIMKEKKKGEQKRNSNKKM